ncbi:hypothetical protein BA950_14930 [Erythrobacter sp. SAORIC-644]|uniref:Abi-alpha family protein n=1 Tax=Erythrobacter sp. SAORIC-644 TaxID=1869314 RepID=UPI000C9F84D4|nr:Abi-alpha family protein [Erythrobacter sp. SAORIC-644]PNQ74358.1 hypothetical protein BA950_14930 [Erythrobacter sp. SAORIC-644]
MSDFGAGEIVKEVASGGRGAMRRVFGPALTEFGEMLADSMKLWRFKNLLRIQGKVDRIAKERSIPAAALNALPFGDSMRTIEGASQEDEDDVQEVWARLIVKAAASETPKVNKLHIELLQSLSPADTALLELLYPSVVGREFTTQAEIEAFNGEMNSKAETTWRKFSEEDRAVSVQNLLRLRCITSIPRTFMADHVLQQIRNRQLGVDGALVDPRRFEKMLGDLVALIHQSSGAMSYDATKPVPLMRKSWFGATQVGEITVPELNHMLTPIGEAFMKAVTLEPNLEDN